MNSFGVEPKIDPSLESDIIASDGLIAFPFHWQIPAATEKAAYESFASFERPLSFEYVGLPWATLIDGLRGSLSVAGDILSALRRISETPTTRRRVTVAQHIHATRFIELFSACGITDIFWSHTTYQSGETNGVRIHPFPLFPAQTPDRASIKEASGRPRRYLANFIGAYNPKVYLTNVRSVIFKDINTAGDLLIKRRDSWHFERAVYKEQIMGEKPSERHLTVEEEHAAEYLSAIRDSWFTLCPSGSGPNCIRIYESLCLGSIPIILTRDLHLPGPRDLWEQITLIEDDSEEGYVRALERARSMPLEERKLRISRIKELLHFVAPEAYARLIFEQIAASQPRSP